MNIGPEPEPSAPSAPIPEQKAKPKVDPAKQAGVLVLGTTLATLSSAIAPLLVVRLIGKADVGRLLSVTLVYETVAMLLSTGFPYTLLYQLSNRTLPERAALARRIAAIACRMGAIGAVLLVVASLILRSGVLGFEPSPTFHAQLGMLMIIGPSLIADLPFRLMPNLLVAEGRARRSAGLQVVRTIALTLATLVPLALDASVEVVIICSAAVRLAFGLWVLRELSGLYRDVARVAAPLTDREFWRFAIPMGATEAMGLLNQQLDRWLVLLALPAARFAEYQVGAWQVPVIGTIAYSVGAAYTPEFVKRFQTKDPRGAIELWRRGLRKVSLLVVPVTMALFVAAEELMTVLFTRDYASAANVFRFYSVLTFLRVASFGTLIVAAGKPKLVVRAAGLGLLFNALFGIPCVLAFGFIGPAMGAAGAFVLQVVVYVLLIAKAADVPARSIFPVVPYLRVFLLAALAGLVGLVVKRSLHLPPAAMLALEVLVVLASFGLLGAATRTILREDWAYARDWLRLRVAK